MIRELEVIKKHACNVPGSFLEGNLKCVFKKNASVKTVKIRFFGTEFANVKLTNEVLFNMDNDVCYAETVLVNESSVPEGVNTYPFKLKIPQHIPSSYISEYGGIRYILEGSIMMSNSKITKICKSIEIFSPIDLKSFDDSLNKKETFSSEKELMGLCGVGGLVTTKINVDRRIFLCGDVINLNAVIHNLSGITVRKINAYLMKSDSCRLQDGGCAVGRNHVIAKQKCSTSVSRNEEKTYQLSIKVPENVMIPNLNNSKFFKTKHWIHVNIHFNHFWRRPIIIIFKVYIGHIPLNI
ncbi:hypothetical protein WA026_011360 [Henosepilachna vigintioctopunctata]|uniref:Arrestin C-terminal-like domain-containing protein n=1 Tax=Henosepilachna vigintioctopunctata TaxID=420089 RepID=A0AAW1TQY1_9CUCU